MQLNYNQFDKYTMNAFPAKIMEEAFVPDEIIGPFFEELRKNVIRYLPICLHLQAKADALVDGQKRTVDEVTAFTLKLCQDLGPDFYNFAIPVCSEGKYLQIEKVELGKSEGSCWNDSMELKVDGSLRDTIYHAHETGHWLSGMEEGVSNARINIKELQSFFLEEMAYEELQNQGGDIAIAAQFFRSARYLQFIRMIPDSLYALAWNKGNENRATIFNDWKISNPTDYEEEFVEKPWFATNLHHSMHRHLFAAPLSVALYQAYKSANEDQQQQMLKTLYKVGSKTTLKDILNVFGIHTVAQLQNAARFAVGSITGGFEPSTVPAYRPEVC